MSARRTEKGGGSHGRPHCLSCRQPMQTHTDGRVGARWRCHPCNHSCAVVYRRDLRARNNEDSDRRPWCVKCRRPMYRHGERRRFCGKCGAALTLGKAPPLLPITERPNCPACARPMRRQLVEGVARFKCGRCQRARRHVRTRPDVATALLAEIVAALPPYLAPDEREDAAQAVILDVLSGQLPPVVPAPAILRRYASEARGMVSDRFRFISLSQQTRDGRELGETLAAGGQP